MTARLPVFTSQINNLCPQDAADLRFFAGEMMVPAHGWQRKDCYKMLKEMQNNTALHPHLRFRARHAVRIGKVFISLQNEKVRMATVKSIVGDYTRIHNFDQVEFNDIDPELKSIDIIMNEIAGQVIVPESAAKMAMALKIVGLNLHTERKFEVFAAVVKDAIEVVFGDLNVLVDRLTSEPRQLSSGETTAEHAWDKLSNNISFLPVAK